MDITCGVCAEPWDSYGVRNEDMEKWESTLFLLGAGCPCCEGMKPTTLDVFTTTIFFDFLETLSISLSENDTANFIRDEHLNKCKWVQPKPTILHTCNKCNVNVVKDSEGKIWWSGGDKVYYMGSNYGYSYGILHTHEEADEYEDGLIQFHDNVYCPGCLTYCIECQSSIFAHNDGELEPYDEGYPCTHPANPFYKEVCLPCYEELTVDLED